MIADNESGSAGMLMLFVIGLFVMIFVFILMGSVHDYALGIHNVTGALGDPFYVSDERINALNSLEFMWGAFLFLGIILPLSVYAIIVSVRKQSGDV